MKLRPTIIMIKRLFIKYFALSISIKTKQNSYFNINGLFLVHIYINSKILIRLNYY